MMSTSGSGRRSIPSNALLKRQLTGAGVLRSKAATPLTQTDAGVRSLRSLQSSCVAVASQRRFDGPYSYLCNKTVIITSKYVQNSVWRPYSIAARSNGATTSAAAAVLFNDCSTCAILSFLLSWRDRTRPPTS